MTVPTYDKFIEPIFGSSPRTRTVPTPAPAMRLRRELAGQRANNGVFITTSGYTAQDRQRLF